MEIPGQVSVEINNHPNASLLAGVFVVGTLVGILEAPPAADVIDEDGLEIGRARFDVGEETLQSIASADAEATLTFVSVGADDLEAGSDGIFQYLVGLVLR